MKTRASLGHTAHPRYAGPMTVMIYLLVNLGAILWVFGDQTEFMVLAIQLDDVHGEFILGLARRNALAGSQIALVHLAFAST